MKMATIFQQTGKKLLEKEKVDSVWVLIDQ